MSLFSFHDKRKFRRQWLLWGAVILTTHFVLGVLLTMILNGTMMNHALTPIFQFLGIFQIIWPEQPMSSLNFLATKSLFAFAHQDPRSGLNLWTLEYDTYTLLVYVTVSAILGWTITNYRNQAISIPVGPLYCIFAGGILVALSMSYMTVIDHCSGATWVGFVALYGMGFDEFELYPAYQIVCAAVGIAGLIGGFIWLRINKNRAFA
jgi:hypothetical protein